MMLVGELEAALLRRFPARQAEGWDRTGMLVGDPDSAVAGVAVALDPTVDSLHFANEHGCNVLVTHHPLFLDPPQMVKPLSAQGDAVGARIWEAVSLGISVMSFHTALDASPYAAKAMAAPLELEPDGRLLEAVEGVADAGYGRLCRGEGMPLGTLAQKCREAFGRPVRVWGDENVKLACICLWTGAAGTCPRSCKDAGVDALVCGEVKYHEALDAAELGLCIVELGHDASEQVLCPILVESVLDAGIPQDEIHLRDLPGGWR